MPSNHQRRERRKGAVPKDDAASVNTAVQDEIQTRLNKRQFAYMMELHSVVRTFRNNIKKTQADVYELTSHYTTGKAHRDSPHDWPERVGSARERRILDGSTAGGGCPMCALKHRHIDLYGLITSGVIDPPLEDYELIALASNLDCPVQVAFNMQHKIWDFEGGEIECARQRAYDEAIYRKYVEEETLRKSGHYKRAWNDPTPRVDKS